MKEDQAYLTKLIEGLITHKDELKVDRIVDDKGVLLTVSLNKEDMGKVIGKGGETARSIRKIMRQFAALNESHIAIKINEPIE